MPTILDAKTVAPRTGSIYPPQYAKEIGGREKRALGDVFGLTQFGVNLTMLPSGAWSSHRHWHENEDEFINVLEGEVVMIDDAGEHLLTAGMCAGYKAGVANGHHLINRSAKPAQILEVGTRATEERVHYSEADMSISGSKGNWKITRKDGSGF